MVRRGFKKSFWDFSELVNTVTAIVKCQSRLDRSLLLVAHFNSTVTDLLRALSTVLELVSFLMINVLSILAFSHGCDITGWRRIENVKSGGC